MAPKCFAFALQNSVSFVPPSIKLLHPPPLTHTHTHSTAEWSDGERDVQNCKGTSGEVRPQQPLLTNHARQRTASTSVQSEFRTGSASETSPSVNSTPCTHAAEHCYGNASGSRATSSYGNSCGPTSVQSAAAISCPNTSYSASHPSTIIATHPSRWAVTVAIEIEEEEGLETEVPSVYPRCFNRGLFPTWKLKHDNSWELLLLNIWYLWPFGTQHTT